MHCVFDALLTTLPKLCQSASSFFWWKRGNAKT